MSDAAQGRKSSEEAWGTDANGVVGEGWPDGSGVLAGASGNREAGPEGNDGRASDPSAATRRVFLDRQWIGIVLGSIYVSLRGPINRPLFSERNRIDLHVLPLGRGWRIVVRKAGGPLGA